MGSQWILGDLKDKDGNPPTSEMWNFIQKLDRSSLVPCPRTADDLQMPEKGTVPREMNSFIVFRRQVAYVAKTLKSSEDGRILSKVASYIWNGASASEKKSYSVIADELKKRHREKNPNYTSQVDCVDPIYSIDDECCYGLRQEYIPQALQMVMARNNMAELSPQINLHQQQPLEEFSLFQQMQQQPPIEQLSPYYDNFNNNSFYYGMNGILNQPELDELNYISYQ